LNDQIEKEVRMRTRINEQRQNRSNLQRRSGTNPPNFGSARSDYGELAYGGNLNKQGMERNWWDKTTDEVNSWLGDEEAERRREMDARRNRNYQQQYNRGNSLGFFPMEGEPYGMAATQYDNSQNWQELRARDIMTRDVITVDPNTPVQHAARMMAYYDCGAIPVVNWQGKMIGMVTDRDITVRLVAEGENPLYSLVGDCMTRRAFACHVNDSLMNCLRSMSRHQVRRMPIVNDRNQVVGIVSQGDIAKYAGENLGSDARRAVGDVVYAISEPTTSSYK
jgi:CBS-domain-containing membrane protein